MRVPGIPLSVSICLIVLLAVSTESDSTGDRRQSWTNVSTCAFLSTASGLFSKQENGKTHKENQCPQACESQDYSPGVRTGCRSP